MQTAMVDIPGSVAGIHHDNFDGHAHEHFPETPGKNKTYRKVMGLPLAEDRTADGVGIQYKQIWNVTDPLFVFKWCYTPLE